MQRTKLLIAAVAVAAIALVAVGLASAQLQANQTYTATQAPNNAGFFGWIGNCFGLTGNQPYYATPYQARQGPVNATAPEPYTPYAPYQGGYYGNGYGNGHGYGYGYGPCWTR